MGAEENGCLTSENKGSDMNRRTRGLGSMQLELQQSPKGNSLHMF